MTDLATKQFRSTEINELAIALAKAQGKIQAAHKDSSNPYFNSKYADLASIWDAIRGPLSENGLSVVQLLHDAQNGRLGCETILLHSSGQWISSIMTLLPVKNDPQGYGSCATYIRRYMLMAIVGVAPEEDDGNQASGKGTNNASSSTKANTGATNPPGPATQRSSTNTSNPPAATESKFDPDNPTHKSVATEFLGKKKGLGLIKPFLEIMKGKAPTYANLELAWNKINPEAPDKEP